MISIHVPTDDVNALRRFVREFRMSEPIAVDTAAPDGGATASELGVQHQPCVFLLDHTGAVHSLSSSNRGGWSTGKDAGRSARKSRAESVPRLPEQESRISDEMDKAVTAALPTWIAARDRNPR